MESNNAHPTSQAALRERGHRGQRVPADGDGWEGQTASPAPLPERVIVAPSRSREQRFEALETANRIRSSRAQLKRDLKAGRVSATTLLDHADCASMKVVDLLIAIPKVGRVKAHRALANARVSPSRTLSGLTSRQRGELLGLLGGTPSAVQFATPAQRAISSSRDWAPTRERDLLADIRRA